MKHIKYLLTLSALFSSLQAFAAYDWIFDYEKYGSSSWSVAIGSETTPGHFYRLDTDGSTKIYIQGSYAADDTFLLGDPTGAKTIQLDLSQSTTVGQISLTGKDWSNSGAIAGSQDFTVTGDFIRAAEANMGFVRGVKQFTIGGNLIINGNNFASDTNTTLIKGDLKGSSNYYSTAGYNTLLRGTTGTFDINGVINPDLIIEGVVDAIALQSKASVKYNVDKVDYMVDQYYRVGGVVNGGKLYRQAMANAGTGFNTMSYFVLANKNDYSTNGNFDESNNNVWCSESGKLALIMNGTASQSFTTTTAEFQGGVRVLAGTLKINFNQYGSGYAYSSEYVQQDNSKKVKITTSERNLIFFTENNGSVRTSFSHGDLVMEGGVFASTDASNSYGAFRFTNIVYKGGTIFLRLDNATSRDSLDLRSYYSKETHITRDLETGEVTNTETTWATVAGGKLSLDSTAAEGTKVTFNFGDNLAWLIDDESGSFAINGGMGAKIVSWDAANKTDLLADQFAGNTFTNADSANYKALFTVADDGLYVKYVAVPEPATVAAIFGALALAFAAYRRRK